MKRWTEEEEKVFAARVIDKINQVDKYHRVEQTDFVDPTLLEVGKYILINSFGVKWFVDGGVEGAERKRLIIYPEYLNEEDILANTVLISAQGNFTGVKISHRDFLGSILGQGIQRGKIGDIWLNQSGAVLVVDKIIFDFLQINTIKVKGVELTITELNSTDWKPPIEEGKIIITTLASLRLDAVAGTGFGTSRTQIVPEIKAGKFKVNWRETKDNDYFCQEGDVISARGRGRIIIQEVIGETKKGRIRVKIQQLL